MCMVVLYHSLDLKNVKIFLSINQIFENELQNSVRHI